MIERNVDAQTVKNTLEKPTSTYPGNKPDRHCAQRDGIRVVYSNSGYLISVITL
jgi:hypothetical protein